MSDTKYIHPQVLQKLVLQKRKQVNELLEQCQEHGVNAKNMTAIEDLNMQYMALKAENEVLKTCNPNVIPKCKTLLFEWVNQKLQEDIKNLEELLSFQKTMRKISFEKELELRKMCPKESIYFSKDFEEVKKTESFKSEILVCLHRKLIRRMRRITREYFPVITANETQVNGDIIKQGKSLFSILQALFPDLKENDALQPDVWGRVEGAYIKKSYPRQYLDLLLSSKIIGIDEERPNFMKIETR